MAQKVRVYDDWTKGTYGAGSPLSGEYTALNCQAYKTGAIGPRPGWKQWAIMAVTSPAATTPTGFNQSADLLRGGFAWRDAAGDEYICVFYYDNSATANDMEIFTVDNINKELDLDSTHNPASGPVAWSEAAHPGSAQDTIYHMWWDGVESVAVSQIFYSDFPSTPVTMTGKPNTPYTVIYRDRMYGTGNTGNASRIYYSDAADYTNWTSTNFFDLYATNNASEAAVLGMWPSKNSLLIATRNGSWWALTGASPETGTLREIDKGPIPWGNGAALMNGNVFFIKETGAGVSVGSPAGLNNTALNHLDLRYAPTPTITDRIASPGSVVYHLPGIGDEENEFVHLAAISSTAGGDSALAVELVNGAWNYHRYAFDSSTGDMVTMFPGYDPNVMWLLVKDGADLLIASRNICLDRPARETDTFSQPLANTDEGNSCLLDINTENEARLVLGDISGTDGALVKPLGIVMDVEYWYYDTAGTATFGYPDMTVDVEVLGLNADADVEVSNSQISVSANTDSWEQMSSSATAYNRGLFRRLEFPIEDMPYGNRIRVTTEFTAIAIHKVTVFYDDQDAGYP